MKKLVLAAAALVSMLVASPSFAQLTGPSALDAVRNDFSKLDGYRVETVGNVVIVKDAASGMELFKVSQVNPQTITISGTVAHLDKLSPEKTRQVWEKIMHFNFSSAVGTLWFDKATGEVTMEHHLNPRQVSSASVVKVAERFGSAFRSEGKVLMQ